MIEPLLLLGILQALITAAYLLFKRTAQVNSRLVSLFMFFLVLPMISELARPLAESWTAPNIIMLIRSYPFTYGPFLYLYTRMEISEQPVFRKQYLLHFLPFLVLVLLAVFVPDLGRGMAGSPFEEPNQVERPFPGKGHHPGWRILGDPVKPPGALAPYYGTHSEDYTPGQNPYEKPDPSRPGPHHPLAPAYFRLVGAGTLLSFIVYSLVIILALQRHRKNLANYFSYSSQKIDLRWLGWITFCFVLSYVYVVLTDQVLKDLYRHPLLDPHVAMPIGLVFFITAFSFFSIKQPVIYMAAGQPPESAPGPEEMSAPRYEKSGLKDEDAEEYIRKIEECMRTEKPYVNGDLTIVDLSEKLSIPKHHITQVLNEKLNRNFYTYVNDYRIRDVLEMMASPERRDDTILRIAFDAGFNSKSSFNAIFKKYTGFTPMEYRKRQGGA